MDRVVVPEIHTESSQSDLQEMDKARLSLVGFPTEVLSSIFDHLGFHDLFRLLLTCKSLYPIAHRQLWSIMEFGKYDDEDSEDSDDPDSDDPSKVYDDKRHYLGPNIWRRLAAMHMDSLSEKLGLDLGWRHTKKIAVFSAEILNYTALAYMLTETLHSGKLRPRQVELHFQNFRDLNLRNEITNDFFLTLKSYFHTADLSRCSIILDTNAGIYSALHLLEAKNITELDLVLGSENFDAHFRHNGIVNLTNLLASTPNLKHLFIYCDPYTQYQPGWEIQLFSAALADLQAVVTNLTKLQTFRVSGSGVFIHPSFFLTPPINVRVFEFNCMTTPLWWLKLSKAVLPNLEDLTISDSEATPSWRQRDLEEANGIVFRRNRFRINSMAITSLKRISGAPSAFGPSDWFLVVLAANKGLDDRLIEPVLATLVEDELNNGEDFLLDKIRKFKQEKTIAYGQKWRQGLRGRKLREMFIRECLDSLAKDIPAGELEE